jgi:hypothetical protein
VGYYACATLRALDVVTGKRSSFPAPLEVIGEHQQQPAICPFDDFLRAGAGVVDVLALL